MLYFSKEKFLGCADSCALRKYSAYLNIIDGKEVIFDLEHGVIFLNNECFLFPIYKEWCVEINRESETEKL